MLNEIVETALRNNPDMAALPDVVEKEILHHDILTVLQNRGAMQRLTFIGGTSLRLCYGSNRLSEDLDFTAGSDFNPNMLAGVGDQLRDYLEEKYGLNVIVHEPRLTSGDTSTWKVTIERVRNRPDLPSQKMHIDVCAYPSLDITYMPVMDHYRINSPMAGLPIPVQSLEEILADKLVAFAYRERRVKPRDVWDLVWLGERRVVLKSELVLRKLEFRNKRLEDFIGKIVKHSELVRQNAQVKSDFYDEMLRFVPANVAQRTLRQEPFWGYVGRTINEYVNTFEQSIKSHGNTPNIFKM